MAVYKRIQKCRFGGALTTRFDKSVTPMDFMFRQLFNRLFIMSPAFIRVRERIQPFLIEKPQYPGELQKVVPRKGHSKHGVC